MANTIGWGKGTQNNSNGWGKFQNTIGAASVYAVSYAGETVIEGTSAAFSYSASSFHQGEADPTPTITGTTGGTFSATPSGLSINTSTGTIDLDNSTIQSYTITYTVSGVSAQQTLSVTASPFIANNFSMEFDGAQDSRIVTEIDTTGIDFSFSCWVKHSGTFQGNFIRPLFHSLATSNVQFGGFILYHSTGSNLSLYDGSNFGSSLSINTWHHVAGVWDNTTKNLKYYLNGSLDLDTTFPSYVNIARTLEIGDLSTGYSSTNYRSWDGKIDEYAFWSGNKLSDEAIQEIYNATANNTGKVLDLNTDTGNYTSSANLQYWNRLGD